ncbi:MAG: calcium-binding protein, partial [Solirubrobacterales bacterium]
TNEEYAEQINADAVTTATFPVIGAIGVTEPGNSRLYALKATGDADGSPLLDGSTLHGPEWPFAVGIVTTGLLPVVGEGITGNPIVGGVDCPSGDTGPNIGTLANNGPAYVLNADASSCYGNGPSGRPNALESDFAASAQKLDTPVLPAVGHPAFGTLGPAPGLSFLAPAAGLNRALDLALPEYQVAGQDFLAAWNTATPDFRPGFPATVNDLQFLTGPSIADLDGSPGEEIVTGTASKDLAAFNGAGLPVDPARWPKASTDWTVANPLIGSFGTRETDEDSTKVVVAMTRSGYINAYATDAPACSPSSWPRFHHDNANSGDHGRDAVLPGRPVDAAIRGRELNFSAPGDDLLCGTADHYEIVTSAKPIDEAGFGSAQALAGAPEPVAAGGAQTYTLPAKARRYVAVRAVDDQGNVGRPAVVERRPSSGGGAGSGPDASGAGTEAGSGGGEAADGRPQDACANPIAGTAGKDELAGTSGPDRIRGRGGADRIKGGDGEDCLSGQGGADGLNGGADADRIDGGAGLDRLRG